MVSKNVSQITGRTQCQDVSDWREVLKVIPREIALPDGEELDSAESYTIPHLKLLRAHGQGLADMATLDDVACAHALELTNAADMAMLSVDVLGDSESFCAAIWDAVLQKFARMHIQESGFKDHWLKFQSELSPSQTRMRLQSEE